MGKSIWSASTRCILCLVGKLYVINIFRLIWVLKKIVFLIFVQTGTLTEDGLDLWGVQRVENSRYASLLTHCDTYLMCLCFNLS